MILVRRSAPLSIESPKKNIYLWTDKSAANNRNGEMIPQRDPNTDAYRPAARAINFRSEPFGVNNLALQEKYFHMEDESLAYSSYTFGDVPTTLPRSYMGDPAKFRLVHGGGEVFSPTIPTAERFAG